MASRLRPVLLLLLVAATPCAAPAGARAAHVDASAAGLTYRAGAGEANRLVVGFPAGAVEFADPGAGALTGCVPWSPAAVRCPLPSGAPPGPVPCDGCLVRVMTGDRDDVARAPAAAPGTVVELDGGSGADVLSSGARGGVLGGPGDDRLSGRLLDGGPGDDRLLTLPAVPASPADVRCGPGEDSARVARGDRVSPDCEHVEVGAAGGPRLRIEGPHHRRIRHGRLRLIVSARAAAGRSASPICAGVVLRAVGGRPRAALARARVARLRAPRAVAVTLELTRRARRELARRPAIRVRVTIRARDARGGQSITRRVLSVRR